MTSKAYRLLMTATVPAAFGACILMDGTILCSDEFVSVQFRVVDVSGEPQDSFVVTVRNVRTGEAYSVRQPVSDEVGVYHALDDGSKDRIHGIAPLKVHGERGDREFDASFLIGVDEDGCHIQKMAGPDTVVVAARIAQREQGAPP